MAFDLDTPLPLADPWIAVQLRYFLAVAHRAGENPSGTDISELNDMIPMLEKIRNVVGPSPAADWANGALAHIAATEKIKPAADPVRMIHAAASPRIKAGRKPNAP